MTYLQYIASFQWLFLVGSILVLTSYIFSELRTTRKFAVFVLFTGALLQNLFLIQADPFLGYWDEEFHALVAKNMLQNPFYPHLLDENWIKGNFETFTHQGLWIHKQPLFLWLMSLSMKLFGVGYWQFRLPSVIAMAAMVFPINSIGKKILNDRVGFWAALFFVSASVYGKLIVGRFTLDHNDVWFAFFILMSIFFYFKYLEKWSYHFAIATGLMAGAAVLIKWLPGILVFSAWGVQLLTDRIWRHDRRKYFHFFAGLMAMLIVALPWQLYCYIHFTDSFLYILKVNHEHFSEIVQGHDGPWNYHFLELGNQINPYFQWISLLAFVFILTPLSALKWAHKVAMAIYIGLFFLFFSLSATKMPMFTFPVWPLVFIAVAVFLHQILKLIQWIRLDSNVKKVVQNIVTSVVVLGVSWWLFNIQEYLLKPEWRQDMWSKFYTEEQLYQNIGSKVDPQKSIFFNFPLVGHVRFTFTTGIQAREYLPSENEIEILKQKGIQIYLLESEALPMEIIENKEFIKVKTDVFEDKIHSNEVKFYR